MAKVNVKLIDVVTGEPGDFYGIPFEMVGEARLSPDKSHFKGVELIACGVDDKLIESLVIAGKLEVLTDKEVETLKAKLTSSVA